MEEYTIYCTEEQTRKALDLGAPIELEGEAYYPNGAAYPKRPTADQMVSWLEEQGILCDVFPTGDYGSDGFGMRIMIKAKRLDRFESDAVNYSTRKEATLAAIDAALIVMRTTR